MIGHVGRRRHSISQRRHKGDAAGFFQQVILFQLLRHGDEVNGLAAAEQIHHRLEHDAVRLAVEIICLEDFRGGRNGLLRQEHSSQHSLFRLDVLRWYSVNHDSSSFAKMSAKASSAVSTG